MVGNSSHLVAGFQQHNYRSNHLQKTSGLNVSFRDIFHSIKFDKAHFVHGRCGVLRNKIGCWRRLFLSNNIPPAPCLLDFIITFFQAQWKPTLLSLWRFLFFICHYPRSLNSTDKSKKKPRKIIVTSRFLPQHYGN